MKKIAVVATFLGFIITSCTNPSENTPNEPSEVIKIQEPKITFLGDQTIGMLVLPIREIDSLEILEIPDNLPDFDLRIEDGLLKSALRRTGNHAFKAKIFSGGKEYVLQDTLRVRMPMVVIKSRFGQYLIADVENKLWVSIPGLIDEDIKLTTDKGVLEKTGNSEYTLLPSNDEKIIVISIWAVINGEKRIFGSQEFLVVDENSTLKEIMAEK